jgi:hypothetical protein
MPDKNWLRIAFDFIVLRLLGKNEGRGSNNMEWVKIVEVHDLREAEIIRSMLTSVGIPIMIKDEETVRIFPGILGNIRILVPGDRLEEAKAVLQSVGSPNQEFEEKPIDK